jgi:hypothetical protein
MPVLLAELERARKALAEGRARPDARPERHKAAIDRRTIDDIHAASA